MGVRCHRARFLAQTVNFTISWNENNGTISGVYQDDHFATFGVTIFGSTSDTGTTFVVKLPDEVDGVAALEFVVTSTASGSIASVTGKSSSGATVFADSDIVLEKNSTGSSGSGDPTTVDGFFAALAGEHEWIAKRSGGTDDQWNAGETYKVTITADKKISLSSNDEPIEIVFGSETSDKFESYDHEAYIIAKRGECEWLLQHQYEAKETFLTCSKGNEVTSPFWKFSAKGGTSTGVLANLGIGGAAGNHAWVVKVASEGHNSPYTPGAEFKFTIDEDANITSDLGEFTYSKDNYSSMVSTSDGVSHTNATWTTPSKTAVPRKQFIIDADQDKLITVMVKEIREGNVTVTWVMGESL